MALLPIIKARFVQDDTVGIIGGGVTSAIGITLFCCNRKNRSSDCLRSGTDFVHYRLPRFFPKKDVRKSLFRENHSRA